MTKKQKTTSHSHDTTAKEAPKKFSFVSARSLRTIALVLVMGTIGTVGIKLTLGSSATVAPPPTTLSSNQRLYPNQTLYSSDGRYRLILQPDGNLVLYSPSGAATWFTGTYGQAPGSLVMQPDGNLVLYNTANQHIWQSNTFGRGANRVTLQPDGNLVLYNPHNQPVWSILTGIINPPPGSGPQPPQSPTTLSVNQRLYPNQSLLSSDGRVRLILQPDGNLVVYNANAGNQVMWTSGTYGQAPGSLVMQPDGNLVLYNTANQHIWQSNTFGRGANRLTIQPDGNLVLYRADNQPVWSIFTGLIGGTPTPPPPTGGASSGGSSGGGSSGNQKTGRVQVTTYVYNPDGTRTRVSGVNLHIQSVGFATTDTAHNCNNYNQTTSASGSAATAGNFGQVHFTDCWTASGGTKAYQLSFAQLPSGMSFRDLKITGPGGATFRSGASSTTAGVNEQFNIMKDQETKLEITMIRNTPATANPSIQQVVTQSGIRYVPSDRSASARAAAAAFTALNLSHIAEILDSKLNTLLDEEDEWAEEDDDLGEDELGDMDAPSAPKDFKAVQDASGSIALSWGAANGNPAGEAVTYSILRIIKDSAEEAEEVVDPTQGLTALDDSDTLQYPQTYIYQITASDESENISDPATVEITTKPFRSNVVTPDDTGTDITGSTAGGATGGATTITSDDGQAGIVVPPGATDENLACAVTDAGSNGDDLLRLIGQPIGDNIYRTICRDDDGNIEEEFDEDIDFYFEFDDSELTDDSELYGFDGTDWTLIPTDEDAATSPATAATQSHLGYTSAKKTKKGGKTVYTVKSKRLISFALVDKKNATTLTAVPVLTLLALLVVGVAIRTMMTRRLSARYLPYGDIDLMQSPSPTYPAAPVIRPGQQPGERHHD